MDGGLNIHCSVLKHHKPFTIHITYEHSSANDIVMEGDNNVLYRIHHLNFIGEENNDGNLPW